MATNKDWQVMQATTLYKLMRLRKRNSNGVITINDLDELIGEIRSAMTEDEIKQVEAQVDKYIK